jgi:hypothetical protein
MNISPAVTSINSTFCQKSVFLNLVRFAEKSYYFCNFFNNMSFITETLCIFFKVRTQFDSTYTSFMLQRVKTVMVLNLKSKWHRVIKVKM